MLELSKINYLIIIYIIYELYKILCIYDDIVRNSKIMSKEMFEFMQNKFLEDNKNANKNDLSDYQSYRSNEMKSNNIIFAKSVRVDVLKITLAIATMILFNFNIV